MYLHSLENITSITDNSVYEVRIGLVMLQQQQPQSQYLKATEINFLLARMSIVGHYGCGKGLLIVIQGAKADGRVAILNIGHHTTGKRGFWRTWPWQLNATSLQLIG